MYDLDEAEEGGISVNIVPLILADIQADGGSSSRYLISSIFAQSFLLNYFFHTLGPGKCPVQITNDKFLASVARSGLVQTLHKKWSFPL